MEEHVYYLCRVRLNGGEAFVAWSPGEPDSFLRDTTGRLLVARFPDALRAATQSQGVTQVGGEPTDYDLDRIREWCAVPEEGGVDCQDFLNAWNFFDDLAGLHGGADTPYARLSREAAGCYDKLFWGSNLAAVTPPGERFAPAWEPDELDRIRRVMAAGVELVESEMSGSR